MTSLQLGLIAGGVALVVGVLIYNWLQERRIRRRITATFARKNPPDERAPAGAARVEPTLAGDSDDRGMAAPRRAVEEGPGAGARDGAGGPADAATDFVPPVDFAPQALTPAARSGPVVAAPPESPAAAAPLEAVPWPQDAEKSAQPDPDIECVVRVQPASPVAAGALAAGLHARVGKPLRWFGRNGPATPWQPLKADTTGTFSELAACLLLADRTGAATRPVIDRFIRIVGEITATLPGAFSAPDSQAEVARAEALDRFCANLDVQIGLTVLKAGAATIPGTRLRGVAEAAGFRLADSGRFEWVHEDTGMVFYTLQNYRSEPFTADNLRLTSTPGAVFILDVPRVADPVRVFDQMKLAAKRLTLTLDAALVDDNRRPLNDVSLAAIRQQVEATASALKEARLDPGSPRALALFSG
jgi:hypothetical protein